MVAIGRVADESGSFSRIRHVAPICIVSRLIHGSLGHARESTDSRSGQPFLRAHLCDQHTDRETSRVTETLRQCV